MFKTQDEIIASLLTIKVEDLEAPFPPGTSFWSKIFGPAPTTPFPLDAAQAIAEAAKHGVQLTTSAVDNLPAGASRFGGVPDMPNGVSWPTRPNLPKSAKQQRASASDAGDRQFSFASPEQLGEVQQEATRVAEQTESSTPLHFVAQINFEELAASGALEESPDMPKQGHLLLFYDAALYPMGFDPKAAMGFRCLYFDVDASALVRQKTPAALRTRKRPNGWKLCAVNAVPCMFPPDAAQDLIHDKGLSEKEHEALYSWPGYDTASLKKATHRLGGWPLIVQEQMEQECALVTAGKHLGDGKAYEDPVNAAILETAKDWQLLLQVDSDSNPGFMWHDAGSLFLWIRKQDLLDRAFDRAWLIMQTH